MLSTPKSKGELFLASSLRDGLEDNDIRQVKTLLLSKEADPNVLIPTHGISPFHLVIGNDSDKFAEEVTKLFLRHGGNPNVRSADGMTPVHVAAAWGRVPVLELLLANGGDPLCLDDDGRSPFHYAFDGNFYNAVTILGKYCGMSQDEEEENEPKYKLTLDKILINKGNVVAEYVPSEDSYSVSSKSEWSEKFDDVEKEAEPKARRVEFENSSPSTASRSTEEFSHLNTNNITIRRYQKRRVASRTEVNLDVAFNESSLAEERLLIGEIISRLSNTFANDSLVAKDAIATSGKSSINVKENNATEIKKMRSFLPPPRYHSNNLKSKETPRRRLVDTSIISKSPNLRIFANDKTPTPTKRKVVTPRSYTCKSRFWNNGNATPPLRSAKAEVRIKSASSTPKRKQYSGRLCEARKLPKKPEKPIDAGSRKNKDVTPTILDKTYSKDRFGFLTYSPDTEIEARGVDRKYLAKNIAVKLDDRMYDENQGSERYCDSPSDSTDPQTSVESPSNRVTRRLKPPRIYNNIKPEVASDSEKAKRCNTASSKFAAVSPHNLVDKEKVNFPISRLLTPKARRVEFQGKPENNFATDDEDGAKAIFDSPGSSNPISVCSLLDKKFLNGNDNEDTKIWLEMEEACRNRCVTPPASVSMIVADNSPSSGHTSPMATTFYSDYGSEDSNSSDFYEASVNIHTALPDPRIMTPISCLESFVSVEEEYTYEDAEEGVAFIERRLCIIPSSTRDERNAATNEGSLIDRFEDLSIAASEYTSAGSPPGKLSRSLLDDKILRERLTALGEQPGPITKTTFHVYLKRLWRLERARKATIIKPIESPIKKQKQTHRNLVSSAIPDFLLPTDWTTKLQIYRSLEEQAFKEYATTNPTRKYRGGISKTSFCYLLLDPRMTRDLPRSGAQLGVEDRWKRFLEGVFYVGQGKAARPAAHLYDAFGVWSKRKQVENISRKIRRILDIWQEGQGIICLHVFSHTMLEEACSREASMIDALETTHLTNCNRGTYYGYTTTMSPEEKRSLGKYLLYKSMEIFMHEGERQLFPRNVIM